ncbi:MAG: acyltransferase family protein [Duganella sp.]
MNKKNSFYRPDIDGLRGIAVLVVVLFHAGIPFLGGGFVGVDVFFVISGYLICSIIHREIAQDRFSFAEFYARRARRILPALVAVLLASSVTALLVMSSAELRDFANSVVATVAAVANIYFWKTLNYFSAAAEFKPLTMTWSLAVEEQFYVFFPVLLLILRRLQWRAMPAVAVLTALSLAASVYLLQRNPTTAFFLLPSRAWEMGVGAMLAIGYRPVTQWVEARPRALRETLAVLGLAMLAVAIFGYDHSTAFPGVAALLPVLGTALLIATGSSVVNRRLLSGRPLVFIGLVSYSWYLWHWPMLSFARLSSDQNLPLATTATIATLSFVVAVLSWRYIEVPFRTSTMPTRPLLWRYAATSVAVVAIAGVMIAGKGLPQRLPDNYVALENSMVNPADPCLANYRQSRPDVSAHCVATRGPALALIGDSHAAALAPAVRALAASQGLGYVQLTKMSCPTLAGVTRYMANHPGHDRECADFNRTALETIGANPAIETVVMTGFWSAPLDEGQQGQRYARDEAGAGPATTAAQSRANLAQGLRDTVTTLQAAGKRVVVLKDVPMFDFDPPRALAMAYIPGRRALAALLQLSPHTERYEVDQRNVLNRQDITDTYVDAAGLGMAHVTVLNPWQALCTHNRCSIGADQQLYYFDNQHVSASGAARIVDGVGLGPIVVPGAGARSALAQ